jgi:mono/diheme cytochrome c family protein
VDRLAELTEDDDLGLMREIAFAMSPVEHGTVIFVLKDLLQRFGDDEILRAAIISGLEGRELEFVQRLTTDPLWQEKQADKVAMLKDLSACVAAEKDPARVERLLRVAASTNDDQKWIQQSLLDGIAVVANPGKGRKPKPLHYKTQPRSVAKLAKSKDLDTKRRFDKIKDFFSWGAEAKPVPPPRALTRAEQGLFQQGHELYMVTCAACHQPTGLGEEGKAPPILDSPWLLGSPKVAAAIVLNGVTGPIEVHGRTYDMTMPALQGFSDEQIAAILTYSRREWEHPGDPVTPELVAELRKAVEGRETPWTVEELKKLAN